jgi:transketolase
MMKTLKMPTKLAAQPSNDPIFSVPVKTGHGMINACDPKANRALISLMDMNAVIGGAACHFGGPSALAELMSALHALVFQEARLQNKNWFDLFHMINDVGHAENGLYALKANYKMAGLNFEKLKKFRSIESPLTGHGEVHCFPEGVFLSNGPLGSAFPQSQGVALGEKLSGQMRTTICVLSDGAAMEGEAKEAFAAIPGLAHKGQMGPYVLIISDNNTKLSGRIDQDSFSMTPTFDTLSVLGWEVLKLEKAHDLDKCVETMAQGLAKARMNPLKPIVIHAKTIKGYGVQKTMESSSGGHGFPLKSAKELPQFLTEIYQGEKYPEYFDQWIEELVQLEIQKGKSADSGEKIQKGVSAAMIKAAELGLPVISVTSDLPGSTGVADFRKKFPEKSVDVGIAESNMVSVAAGLSKLGFIPVVDTFAQFGVTKGALPLTMASLSEAAMIGIYSHTGFQDAADGASHQALTYFAMTSSIPHVKTYALSCSEEAEALVLQAAQDISDKMTKGETPDSHLFFLGRESFPKTFGAKNYQLGQAQLISETEGKNKTLIVANGSLLPQAVIAAEKCQAQGIGTIVVNASATNHLNLSFYQELLKKTEGRMVTIEDHQVIGGFGQQLIHGLVEKGIALKTKSLGVKGQFGQSAYNAIDLYQVHKMDSVAICEAVKALVPG